MKRKMKYPARVTVGEWMEIWLRDCAVNRIKTSTRAKYEDGINHHITPFLGKLRLSAITQSDINEFYQNLLRNGRVDGKGGLSIKSIRNIHIVLHRALRDAVISGRITTNPASGANIPTYRGSHRKYRAQALSLSEQRALIALCSPDTIGTAIVTALGTGLRIGELLGLRWADVDLNAGTLSVCRQLSRLRDYSPDAPKKTHLVLEEGAKSDASIRVIPIDPTVLDRLQELKNGQSDATPPRNGIVPPDMVFVNHKGGFLDPDTFRYRYRRILAKAGLRWYPVHTLRHTFATRALEAGIPVKAVSQILGHADSKITMDTYSHVLPVFQAEAMARIAQYVYGMPG